MAKEIQVRVPDIGDYKNVPVIEVLVQEGQRVGKDAALITLESEKATMEVPSPEAGIVRGIKVKAGGKLSQGDVICSLEVEEGGKRESEGVTETAHDTKQIAESAPKSSVPIPPRRAEAASSARRGEETNASRLPPPASQ
ncbi:MAG: hypothetical protein HYZ32_05110, partial [Hydrocarboniphaga effusa]|nr:hypothetical protein [Hydrocarboniphaga effusa]